MIECYYGKCPNHLSVLELANGVPPEDVSGPFCSDQKCTASTEDLEAWQKIRDEELRVIRLRVQR